MANRPIKTLFVGIAAYDWLAKHRHSHTDRIFEFISCDCLATSRVTSRIGLLIPFNSSADISLFVTQIFCLGMKDMVPSNVFRNSTKMLCGQ